MSEIVKRLIADLRWRLSAAGRPFRPDAKELQSWGGLVIPWSVPLLLWPLAGVLLLLLVDSFGMAGLTDVLAPILILAAPFGLFGLRASMQRSANIAAYRKLLKKNERFVLSEYSKYLARQARRVQQDQALGGPAEVQRLLQLQKRLHAVLKQGISLTGEPVRSRIADEVDLAEAVVSSYEEGLRDPLADLDARLPDELKQRVSELEQELRAAPRPQQPQA